MKLTEFRKELIKIMPGYKWTVHKSFYGSNHLKATGIQASGFNRTATLQVVRRDKAGHVEYEVKSAGYGKKSAWLSEATDETLARALRSLQSHYETMAAEYSSQANVLQMARML